MKITDYASRPAAMDSYLKGQQLTGVEVGCDVGAHAEALLKYCDIKLLHLVDLFENDYCKGYCEGRLFSQGFKNNVDILKTDSTTASVSLAKGNFDFIYIDIGHDKKTVEKSLTDWWKLLNVGGVMGYRNYSDSNYELRTAIDIFIKNTSCQYRVENYCNEIILFK